MEFHSVSHIDGQFKLGGLTNISDTIKVHGLKFNLLSEHTIPIREMINNKEKSFVVYCVDNEDRQTTTWNELLNQGIINEWIVLIWDTTNHMSMIPAGALSVQSTNLTNLEEKAQNVITDEIDIQFDRFGKSIQGKVDTGANMSSMHVDGWELLGRKDRVQFSSHLLSDHQIIMDVIDQIVVKTSEGSEYRPVVQFQITIDGVSLKDAQFNLNDRSGMQHPILVGQNILERGNFLIDPTRTKDTVRAEGIDWHEHVNNIDWSELQERFKEVKGDPYFHLVANNIENLG